MEAVERKIDRRIIKTRRAINQAFADLILTNEIDDITITMITEEADIGRKTFYLHYFDKYDLLDQVIDEYLNLLGARCDNLKLSGFQDTTLEWFAFLDEHHALFKRLFESKGSNSFRNKFLAFTIEQLKKKEELLAVKEGYDFKLHFLGYAVTGIVEEYVLKDLSAEQTSIAQELSDLVKKKLVW